MKKILGLFILFLSFQTILFAQEDKMRLAIMDLQAIGTSEDTAKSVSDILRTELFNTGIFRVLERSEMDKILKEQGFQQSGCTEVECAVQMGKILSARKILVGTVNKLGDAFVINARIVDVELGEMEFADNVKVQSESELDTACKTFAQKLADRISKSIGKKKQTKVEEPQKIKVIKPDQVEQKTVTPSTKYTYPLRTIGFISVGTSLICLGIGYIMDSLANQNNSSANGLYNIYENATSNFQTKYNAYKDKANIANSQATIRNILYICSGVTATGILTFLIRKPVPETTSLIITPDQIKLTVKF